MTRSECADLPTKRPRLQWKLIIAADTVWNGGIYHTRPGHQRSSFCSIEAFCRAVMEVTGWPLDVALDRQALPHSMRARGCAPKAGAPGCPSQIRDRAHARRDERSFSQRTIHGPGSSI